MTKYNLLGATALLSVATRQRAYLDQAVELAGRALDLYERGGRLFTQDVVFNAIFFKNLLLTAAEYEILEANLKSHFDSVIQQRLIEIRTTSPRSRAIKVPTAFLIETCGLKGYRMGAARVNETQPLVLLNEGGATADDVLRLARHIRQTVFARTGMVISLEPELAGIPS